MSQNLPGDIERAAQALRQAHGSRTLIPRISETYGITGLDAAQAIARLNHRARQDEGRRAVGMKIGLTARARQQQLGTDHPVFGVLFDDMEFLHQQDIPTERLIQPKLEAEMDVVVGRDLVGDTPSYAEFLTCLAFALPAIEIVDCVFQDWKMTLTDMVSDNAASGLFVLGDQPVELGRLSLADLRMQMTINGQMAASGDGTAGMDHPLRAAFWLARTLAASGPGLRAGQVILSGSLGIPMPVQAGDLVQVRIDALGTVSCRMA